MGFFAVVANSSNADDDDVTPSPGGPRSTKQPVPARETDCGGSPLLGSHWAGGEGEQYPIISTDKTRTNRQLFTRSMKMIDVNFKRAEPVGEFCTLGVDHARRFVHQFRVGLHGGESAEFNLNGCAFAFAGEDVDVRADFTHEKLDVFPLVLLDGQFGVRRDQRGRERTVRADFEK